MTNIFKPYMERVIKQDNLPNGQKALLILDCYPVHTGEAFWNYILKEFPDVFLMYIPANCES
jgi:hypothetical protein